MSMIGYLYRIAPSRLESLLDDPAIIENELYPDEFPANIERHGKDVEKVWNAIEFILDRLAEKELIPWVGPLTEGTETGCMLHYGPVWYRTPKEVCEIANVLSTISRETFRKGFIPKIMANYNVYPDIWDEKDTDGLFDYVWGYFQTMTRFYRTAADDGDAILLHLG